jgi:hypothetical protein
VHAERIGTPDAPLLILLRGLSAYLHGIDYVVSVSRPPIADRWRWTALVEAIFGACRCYNWKAERRQGEKDRRGREGLERPGNPAFRAHIK